MAFKDKQYKNKNNIDDFNSIDSIVEEFNPNCKKENSKLLCMLFESRQFDLCDIQDLLNTLGQKKVDYQFEHGHKALWRQVIRVSDKQIANTLIKQSSTPYKGLCRLLESAFEKKEYNFADTVLSDSAGDYSIPNAVRSIVLTIAKGGKKENFETYTSSFKKENVGVLYAAFDGQIFIKALQDNNEHGTAIANELLAQGFDPTKYKVEQDIMNLILKNGDQQLFKQYMDCYDYMDEFYSQVNLRLKHKSVLKKISQDTLFYIFENNIVEHETIAIIAQIVTNAQFKRNGLLSVFVETNTPLPENKALQKRAIELLAQQGYNRKKIHSIQAATSI